MVKSNPGQHRGTGSMAGQRKGRPANWLGYRDCPMRDYRPKENK